MGSVTSSTRTCQGKPASIRQSTVDERQVYHLTADYNWGWSQEKSIQDATANAMEHRKRCSDASSRVFSQFTLIGASGLNHYGKDMVNSLTQAF